MFIPWVIELIIRIIPEILLFVGASFVLTKTKIDKKNFVLSSCILCIVPYITRLLPVDFGITSLLALVFLTFLNVKINKIKPVASIKASALIFIAMFISEFISIVFMQVAMNLNMNEIFKNPVTKAISGIPSLFIFAVIIFTIHKVFMRSKKLINL
jgi:hypothetical protein